jgi:hypothetical protein
MGVIAKSLISPSKIPLIFDDDFAGLYRPNDEKRWSIAIDEAIFLSAPS